MTLPKGAGTQTGRPMLDWILFAVLSLIWAGAYPLTRLAVGKGLDTGLPPEWVLPGRLLIGAIFLWAVLIAMRKQMPPLSDRRRWTSIIGMSLVGSVIPFFLITTAQETVDSSLAALYTAASPVFVAIGANLLFAEERMTARTGVGVVLGFVGVGVLFGPEALESLGSASTIAQLLLLLATAAYAASTLIARAAPPMDAIAFAASYATVSAVVSMPMTLTVDPAAVSATWINWLGVLGLGLGSSGLAQVVYMMLVVRAGATFVSLNGYAIPVISAAFGWIFFHETQSWNALLAFCLILGGVWLARSGGRGRLAVQR
ncbi:MAG: DMT family transporter [Acidobacteria bacterium]|jgi:drug/metabolite transporter (DMT)-like permease|nr:DMT family transporter [Acidobacteriota bacterium]